MTRQLQYALTAISCSHDLMSVSDIDLQLEAARDQ